MTIPEAGSSNKKGAESTDPKASNPTNEVSKENSLDSPNLMSLTIISVGLLLLMIFQILPFGNWFSNTLIIVIFVLLTWFRFVGTTNHKNIKFLWFVYLIPILIILFSNGNINIPEITEDIPPIQEDKPKLAQSRFFDDTLDIPTGYKILGDIPSDGSEVEFEMPITTKVKVCFKGAYNTATKGIPVQAIYLDDDVLAISTKETKCKEYPEIIQAKQKINLAWKSPSQQAQEEAEESGQLVGEWPGAVIIYSE